MKIIAFLIVYLGGGLALYPYLDVLYPVGVSFDNFYNLFSLELGADLWVRLGLSFIYASLFHLVCASFYSESAKGWVSTINIRDICYLFLRSVGFFVAGVLVLGLVGMTAKQVPHTDFHQYFGFLVICMLVGVWVWSVKDFFVAIINYAGRII